jgi:o-succinylbenzoate synthase
MAKLSFQIKKHSLDFHFEAGTSRGVLTKKNSYYVQISDPGNPEIIGIGEAGPLRGLSPEFEENCLDSFKKVVEQISLVELPKQLTEIPQWLSDQPIKEASFKMAIEMAIRDLLIQKNGIYFENTFAEGQSNLNINGLIWMGNADFMQKQIEDKLAQGYQCLKLKIGALDFDTEIEILRNLRARFSENELTIRVDANGAFDTKDAEQKLEKLSAFKLHSIEQPIKAGQWNEIQKLISQNILPIALDEELIGIREIKEQNELLSYLKPDYIILKPSLLGGFTDTQQWIEMAEGKGIAWWITSALESNVGLQAIAQFTANYPVQMPQGLGTGQLYQNNYASGLSIEHGQLKFDPKIQRSSPFSE